MPPLCILIDCHNPAEPLQGVDPILCDRDIIPGDPGIAVVEIDAHQVGCCLGNRIHGAVEVHIECVALSVDFGFFIQGANPGDVREKGGEVHRSGVVN